MWINLLGNFSIKGKWNNYWERSRRETLPPAGGNDGGGGDMVMQQGGAPEYSGAVGGCFSRDVERGSSHTITRQAHGCSMSKLSSDGLYFLRKQEARTAAQSRKERRC